MRNKVKHLLLYLLVAVAFFALSIPAYAASFDTVLIGDSRTVGMYNAVYNKPVVGDNINTTEGGEKWIAKTGENCAYAQQNWNAIKSQVSKDTKIIVLMGVNDLNSSGYQSLLSSMKNTCDNVYFVSVTPVIEGKGGYSVTNSQIQSFNSSMKSYCDSNGVTYIDIYSKVQSELQLNPSYSSDGVHYNATLYKKIYNMVTSYADGNYSETEEESYTRNEEASEPVRDLAPSEEDEANAFSPEVNEVKKLYMTNYGWDFNKAKVRYWENPIDGKDKEFERQAGWQEEFLGDNINTTKQYLGLDKESNAKKGAGAEDVVRIALAEVGKDDSVEAPLGSDNVKYNTWYYGKEIDDGEHPWSGVFVSWVMNEADLIDSGFWKKLASVSKIYDYVTGTLGFKFYNSDATTCFGGNSYTPVPGDLMFFKEDGKWTQVGIITSVESDGWYTVQGDVDNKVQKIHYGADDPDAVVDTVVIAMEYPKAEYGDGTKSENIQTIFNFLTIEMGYNEAAAVGVLANMDRENDSFDPHRNEDSSGAGYGICQWTGARRTKLVSWCQNNGYDSSSLEGQLWYLKHETETSYSFVHSYMLDVPNTSQGASDAAFYWCVHWEAPLDTYGDATERAGIARDTYWPQFGV